MVFRILLLLGVSYLVAMQDPFFTLDLSWIHAGMTGQSLILFLGGVFLLYKSTKEIHHKIEDTQAVGTISRKLASSFLFRNGHYANCAY